MADYLTDRYDSGIILVSGGAKGVDKTAETTWLGLGGRVWSFRPKQLGLEEYRAEFWDLGGAHPQVVVLTDPHPTAANYTSACLYRDWLIAENCDRLVAFFRPGKSRGAGFTLELARSWGVPTHAYEGRERTEYVSLPI